MTGEKIPILNGTDLSEDNFIDASIINNEKNFDDIKATTEGNISVGATGDFSTFALAFSDLGNLTNNLNLKQISNITETTLAQGTEVLGGFNLNIYSQSEHIGNYNKGYLIQINHNADFLDNRFDGPGNLNIYKLKIIRTTTSDVSSRALILNSNNTIAFNLSVYNCIMNGNNLSGTGIRCASNIPILFIYENLIFDNTDGIMIDGTDGNASSIYENNSIYSNTSGFDLSNNDGTCINNISMDNTTDFLNIGSATGNNNADSDGTGTNLNWNSGSNNLINKVPGTEFESTTFSDDDFLIPKTTSDLIGAGLSPTISNNLRYINEIFIDTSDVIIGAKGRSKGNYFNQRYW